MQNCFQSCAITARVEIHALDHGAYELNGFVPVDLAPGV
jgi:hypothetical protein